MGIADTVVSVLVTLEILVDPVSSLDVWLPIDAIRPRSDANNIGKAQPGKAVLSRAIEDRRRIIVVCGGLGVVRQQDHACIHTMQGFIRPLRIFKVEHLPSFRSQPLIKSLSESQLDCHHGVVPSIVGSDEHPLLAFPQGLRVVTLSQPIMSDQATETQRQGSLGVLDPNMGVTAACVVEMLADIDASFLHVWEVSSHVMAHEDDLQGLFVCLR